MKNKWTRLGIVSILALMPAIFISAAPNSDFSWTAPTNYENGQVIDFTADPLTYSIYCSDTSGGPYTLVTSGVSASSITNVDVGICVNGIAGTYYFVATAFSPLYNAESTFSNEASKTYTVQDLGQVPNPPTLLSVQ